MSETRLTSFNFLVAVNLSGFGGEEAVRVVRAYVAYVAGSLVREVGVTPGLEPQRPLGQDPAVLAADRPFLDPAEFPQVMSLSAELLNRDFEADFEFGLDLLIRATGGIPRLLNQAAHQALALAEEAQLDALEVEVVLEALHSVGLEASLPEPEDAVPARFVGTLWPTAKLAAVSRPWQ